jgi:hypothetical protein
MTSPQPASRTSSSANPTSGESELCDTGAPARTGRSENRGAPDRQSELLRAIDSLADARDDDGWLPRLRSTRRVFVAFLGALFLRPSLAFAQGRDSGLRAPEVLRTLCDHFIPAFGKSPGALALGVDGKLLELFERAPQGRLAMQQLAAGLGGAAFLAMPRNLQKTRLRGALASGPMSRQLNLMLSFCTQSYYSDPRAWVSLGYRTPQPSGYPDYASHCRTETREGRHGTSG